MSRRSVFRSVSASSQFAAPAAPAAPVASSYYGNRGQRHTALTCVAQTSRRAVVAGGLPGTSASNARKESHFGDDRPCIRETRRRGYGQSPRPPPPGGLRSSTVTSKIFCEFSRLALRAQARGFHQSQHDAVERTHDQPARPGVLCAQPFRLCPCEHCRHPHDGRRAQRAQQEMKSPAESGAVCRQRSPGTSQRQRGKSVFIGAGSSAELRSPRRTFSFGTPHSGRELSERRRSVAAHSHEPNGEGQ